MNNISCLFTVLLLIGCDVVESDTKTDRLDAYGSNSPSNSDSKKDSIIMLNDPDSTQSRETLQSRIDQEGDSVNVSILDAEQEFQYVDQVILNSGLKINWIERKRGRKLHNGEMILIEYRLGLPDGKIIDGNNKMKMPHLPFVIGYNMQQTGWDIALAEMCVGDFAKIEIPAALAYGKKGLGSVIPPNTDNWLFVKIHGMVSPDYKEGGIRYWELRAGVEDKSEDSKIKFHMIASTKNKSNIFNTYSSNFPLTYMPGQKNYPKGLEQVLKKAKKDQHLFVILDSQMAYGDKGYLDLVGPNESVFYNLKIIDIE